MGVGVLVTQERWIILILAIYLVPGFILGTIAAIRLSRSLAIVSPTWRPHVRWLGLGAILIMVFGWPFLLIWALQGPRRG